MTDKDTRLTESDVDSDSVMATDDWDDGSVRVSADEHIKRLDAATALSPAQAQPSEPAPSVDDIVDDTQTAAIDLDADDVETYAQALAADPAPVTEAPPATRPSPKRAATTMSANPTAKPTAKKDTRALLKQYAANREKAEEAHETPEGVTPYVSPKASLRKKVTHYIETRWYPQWQFYDTRASFYKTRHLRYQTFIALGSVSVPILIGFNNLVPNWIPALVSGMVAAATAIENVQKNGDNWRAFRNAAEGLNREKVLYEAMAGPYARTNAPFRLFVERSEDIIAEETGRYFERQQEEQGESEVDSTDGEGDAG